MPAVDPSRFRNHLLAALPPDELEILSRDFVAVTLPRRTQLEFPLKKINHVYFMESGITSIVATANPAGQSEIGIVGREGMTGLPVLLMNDRFPYSAYLQVDGSAQRVSADAVRAAMERSLDCRRIFLGFAQSLMVQISETAVANARALVEERLARWLLMVRDRVDSDEIPLTHEFLSLMMGARRPGVTEAIHALARKGLVTNKRAAITIVDRPGLEERAGRYYGVAEQEQRRVLPPPKRHQTA